MKSTNWNGTLSQSLLFHKISSSKAAIPKHPQTASPNGDEYSAAKAYEGHCSFEPLHCPSLAFSGMSSFSGARSGRTGPTELFPDACI